MNWKVEVKKFYPFMLRMKNATLLGYADIVIDNLLEVRGVKLLRKDNGAVFILPPSVQSGEGSFAEVVKFVNPQLKEKIRKTLSDYYKERFGTPKGLSFLALSSWRRIFLYLSRASLFFNPFRRSKNTLPPRWSISC